MNSITLSRVNTLRPKRFGAQNNANQQKEKPSLLSQMIRITSPQGRPVEEAQHAWACESIKETILPSLAKR